MYAVAISYNGDGTFTYDPTAASYFETQPVGSSTDTFTYTVTDNHGVTASATATVTVNITDRSEERRVGKDATTDEDPNPSDNTTPSVEDGGDAVDRMPG